MTLLYLDTETTGLTLEHDIWEIAFAFDDGQVESMFVPHNPVNADPAALELNGYWHRWVPPRNPHGDHHLRFLIGLLDDPVTVVGANPSFDTYRLERRWGSAPWHYRLLDVEAYAMPYLRLDKPCSLNHVADALRSEGHPIPIPDHTAARDVETVRAVHLTLRDIYREAKW